MIYPNEKTNSLDSKAVLKRFLEIFLTLTLLIIVAALVVFQTETNSAQAIIAENESQTLDLQAQVIGGNFRNIISDVRFLARLSDAQSLANDPNDETARWKLNQDLFIFARQMQVYNRIQFFDSAGTELVRANYTDSAPALWPDDASQSKSNRADLDATLSLNQNEIYISPFELNSDQPPKPVIRFGTPVFDRAGVKRGVLLVNYVGVVLLDNLKYTSTQSAGTVMMLNADGYFLIGPTPADEWGFMYPDPGSHTFSAIYPSEDPQISREAGQFTDSAGLFTFKTVYPLADGLQTMVAREKSPDLPAAQKGSRDYHWKIVSRVPPEVLAMRGRQVTQTLIPLALAALVILGYGSYLLARAIVRRQHVEEVLHEQFGFLEKLLDTIPNPVWFKDLTGIYRGCNKAYEDFYGITRTRLIGKTAEDIHPKEIAARYRELDEALLRNPGTQQQEATARRADGIVREVVLSKATYTTTEGKLAGIVGVILDITERKQMEVQVAQLKQFNESIVQGMTEGIVMDDPDGKIVFVNPATAAMLGYAENELIGQHWSAVASPDQQEIVRNSNKKRALGEKSQYEIEITRKDGTGVTTLVSGKPRYENGQYVGTLAVFTDITERKTAEERLRQFSRAVEQSPASIVITDTDGNIQYVNPKFLRVTGYTFEEALGKNPRVLKSGETPSEEYKKLWDTITAGGEWHGEFHNKKKNGEMYWESASISAITDDKGKVTRFLAVKEDITARKEMERKLAEERNQLDTILNNLPAMVFIKDREGRYIFSNREHIRLLGGTQLSDVVGKTSDAFFPSDLSANVRNDDKQVFEFGTAINNQEETSIDPQTGQLLVRLTTKVPLRDVAGNIVGLLGIARDITERKRAEEVLRESEERFRAVAESAHDAIVTTDSSGVVVGWNRGAQEMFGYDTNEIVGQSATRLMPIRYGQNHQDGLVRVSAGGEAHVIGKTVELHGIHKDGSEFPLELSLAMWETAQGKFYTGIIRDITERKHAELELKKAKEAAEQATRAKGEFLANMSHEIRTPMNAVIGMTSLLLDTGLDEQQRDFCETIRASGDALLAIINEILDFSKIESGHLELERQPFELCRCVEESLDLVAPKASEKGLDLAYTISNRVPDAIYGDITRLRQILVNLFSNAVKFTETGEVTVAVDARPCGEKNFELQFAVKDTGIGIPPDRMDRLFKSFSQVDASTTRRFGGTGLGLVISKRLAELMGGEMRVESEGIPGKGTTFRFTIQAEAAPTQPTVNLRAVQPQLAGARVLIVDDNATNRKILALQLQTWGMASQVTATGDEALEWIRRGDQFALALLDMQMPGMDGITLATEIRKLRDERTLPLVMLTSVGSRTEAERSAPVQFVAFLHKPVKMSQLYNAMVDALAQHPQRVREPVAHVQIDARLAERHPLRILLAEDNLVNQKVALLILRKMGYRADVAANGSEVLDALARQPYDVVLMDVQMPEMDGLEATRHIRNELPRVRQPRIIAMTAEAMQGDREICLEAGMDDYVTKPVRVEELVSALERTQPIASPTDSDTLDQHVLDELCDAACGEMQMIVELVELFQKNTPGLIAQLRESAVHQDAEGLCRAAHMLKSASANLGARGLAAVCKTLEEQGKTGKVNGAVEEIAQVEEEYARALDALRRFVAKTELTRTRFDIEN